MSTPSFTLTYPAEIVFEPGGALKLAGRLARFKKILLIPGTHFSKTAQFDDIVQSLADFELHIVTGIQSEPPLEDVDRLISAGRTFQAEAVVAIGGGSVIDCAKAAAALIPLEGACADYFNAQREISGKGLFFAALPTTSGTGAEITSNSVLTDTATRIKKSLRHPTMAADLAMVDPLLTLSCPPALTAASGLDAFVQAFESCTSPKASSATKALAYAAIRKIYGSLELAYLNGSDRTARSEMAEGSLLSGMAFSQTGLGAIHGLAHPIGSLLHVPHGKACATLIPVVVLWNMSACADEYASIARGCGLGDTASDFLEACRGLCKKLEISGNFSEYGLNESHFDFIVKNCRSASMKLNPRPMSDGDVRALLGKLV